MRALGFFLGLLASASAQATRWYYTGVAGESCDTLCTGLKALDNTTLSLACDLSAFSLDGAYATYFPASKANMSDIYLNRLATGYLGAGDPAVCNNPMRTSTADVSYGPGPSPPASFDVGVRYYPEIDLYFSTCTFSPGPSIMNAAALGENPFLDGGYRSACSARNSAMGFGGRGYARLCPCKAASEIPTPSPRPRGGACLARCSCAGSGAYSCPMLDSLPSQFIFADNWPYVAQRITSITLVCRKARVSILFPLFARLFLPGDPIISVACICAREPLSDRAQFLSALSRPRSLHL